MIQRTLIIIKADGVCRKNIGRVIDDALYTYASEDWEQGNTQWQSLF